MYNVGRSREPCSVLATLILGEGVEDSEKCIICLEVFKYLSLFLKVYGFFSMIVETMVFLNKF